MKKIFALVCVLGFSAAAGWAGSGADITLSQDIADEIYYADREENADEEIADSFNNSVTVNADTFTKDIITALSEHGDAYQNELHINGGTITSSNLKAGAADKGDARENTLRINDAAVQSNVVAGDGNVNATDNLLVVNHSTVNHNPDTDNKLIAGKAGSGAASYNDLDVLSGSAVAVTAAAGYSDGAAEVSYNTLSVDGGSTLSGAAAYGGYASEGHAVHNQITLTNAGDIAADLYGGYSNTGAAEYNLVLVEQSGDISGAVYGGYTAGGTQAYRNEVRLNAGQLSASVYGGRAAGTGAARDNRVTVSSEVVLSDNTAVYGGYAEQGEASGNEVTMASASAGKEAYGGYSAAGAANGNSLSVSGAQAGGSVLAGGWAASGTASENTLALDNVHLAGNNSLYGGYGASGVSGNILTADGSALAASLYGGWTQSGNASDNRVSVSGGTVTGNIYGGYTGAGAASGNTVELNDVTISGDVYGGYAAAPAAEGEEQTKTVTNNNTVILSGNTKIAGNFYGGNGEEAAGNTLLLRNYSGTINAVNDFDNVTVYGLGSDVTFDTEIANGVQVELYGKPTETAQVLAHTAGNTQLTLNRDVLGAYVYSIEGVQNGGYTDWSVKGRYQNHLAKPYAQAQLAGLALATLGDEMLAGAFDAASSVQTDSDSFGHVQYYDNSYDTGSGFDMNGVLVQGGHWYKPADNVWGWFLQYGYGKYATEPMKADGGINSFGLGGFALFPYSEDGRFEAVLRAGYQTGDFDSGDLSSNLDRDGFYGGLSAGLVQNVSLLQFYGKINWLYLSGDDVYDNLGQNIDFGAVQSLSGRIGARLSLGTLARYYKPYVGLSGIYEMDGDSNVSVDGHNVSGADLGGLTGRAEIGVSYEKMNPLLPVKASFAVFGQAGQAEGFGGHIRLAFSF